MIILTHKSILQRRHFYQNQIIVLIMISNGNRTEWSPVRSVIIRVINKIVGPLLKSKQKKFQFCLLVVKKSHLSARVMARTVQLLRHDAYCPIKLSN